MNWDSSFENFKNYLKLERGLSINSIKSYEYDLNLFKNFIQSNKMSATPIHCRPETVTVSYTHLPLPPIYSV